MSRTAVRIRRGRRAACPLERTPEVALFSRVAETGQPEVGSLGAVEPQVAADRLCAPDRHDGDALGREIPAAADCKRLQGDLVAHTFDEHD